MEIILLSFSYLAYTLGRKERNDNIYEQFGYEKYYCA